MEAWLAELGLDWELILVDDGSVDASRRLMADWAAARENVQVTGSATNRVG